MKLLTMTTVVWDVVAVAVLEIRGMRPLAHQQFNQL